MSNPSLRAPPHPTLKGFNCIGNCSFASQNSCLDMATFQKSAFEVPQKAYADINANSRPDQKKKDRKGDTQVHEVAEKTAFLEQRRLKTSVGLLGLYDLRPGTERLSMETLERDLQTLEFEKAKITRLGRAKSDIEKGTYAYLRYIPVAFFVVPPSCRYLPCLIFQRATISDQV